MADRFHEWWDKAGYTSKDEDLYEDVRKAWYAAREEVLDNLRKVFEHRYSTQFKCECKKVSSVEFPKANKEWILNDILSHFPKKELK